MKKESKNRFCFKKARWILAAVAALSLYPGSVFAEENIEVENTAAELLKNTVKKYRVKSKTVNADGIELTTELKIKDDKMAFVNRMNEIAGVKNATLVSYNGVYMS